MERLYGSPVPGAPDLERRFGGVARLYGAASLARFGRARIAVIGLGGVGTWVAEGLARSGVGNLTLIDLDHISESNTNRQIHALDPEFGRSKVQAMAQRILAIHPGAAVTAIEDFVTPENVRTLVADIDLVVDCIDVVVAKAALIAHARSLAIGVVTCGGAGGRIDPARIRCDDLACTRGDPLLADVRRRLRREFGFAAAGSGRQPPRFGVDAIFSDEPTAPVAPACDADGVALAGAPGSPLACGGYGSAVTVTATMGFAAAACALAKFQGA